MFFIWETIETYRLLAVFWYCISFKNFRCVFVNYLKAFQPLRTEVGHLPFLENMRYECDTVWNAIGLICPTQVQTYYEIGFEIQSTDNKVICKSDLTVTGTVLYSKSPLLYVCMYTVAFVYSYILKVLMT